MTEFSRQPRLMPEYPSGETRIDSPVSVSAKPDVPRFGAIAAPLVMTGVTAFIFLAGGSGYGLISNPLFLISSLAMTGVSIIGSIISLNHRLIKRAGEKKRRDKKYKEYLAEKEAELSLASARQVKALRQLNPSPDECVRRMNSSPPDPRLWERAPGFNDFLSFRLGIGTAGAALRVADTREPGIMETDPLMYEPRKLALKYEKVQDVPVCVDLRSAQICGIVGPKEKTVAAVNHILIQIAANHGYDHVRVFILAGPDAYSAWEWSRFLPHLWNDSLTARRVIRAKDTAKLTLNEVYADLRERESKGDSVVFPFYYVFIVESPELIEDEPIRGFIYKPNAKIGVTAIFTAEHAAFLPTSCGAIVTLREKTGELIDLGKNEKNVFTPDSLTSALPDTAARRIAPLRVKSLAPAFSLPKTFTLRDMLRETDLTAARVLENWRTRRTYDGMDVYIGVKADGGYLSLDPHETGHGPHGLVAGTTGSGKSELLQSFIIALAINFHPHDVAFVLIDYKGGGMADAFKGMPHLAGVITNLSGAQTARALLSIKSEIRRRQSMFAEFGVNSIDKYQRLYHGSDRPDGMKPIPHLMIIADEFAELRQDKPEFMKELVSAARVGRSLGIHLILATQKPDGIVDDQIWSNSRFRISLKVRTESDSYGILKKPDAAYIRDPGRAYLQVGNDEIFELFQSVYSGAEYSPDTVGNDERDYETDDNDARGNDACSNDTHSNDTRGNAGKAGRGKEIYRLTTDGRATRIYPVALAGHPRTAGKSESQLEVMVRRITDQAGKMGIVPVEGLWTEPLEETLYMNELPEIWRDKPAGTLLSALGGIVDDPRGQRKFALEFDFANNGGLLIYGAAGSGKTTLVKTLCLSLALRYPPEEVNLYILDMGGATLKVFGNLPHCGGVLTVDQEQDIRRFTRFLSRIADHRKEVFKAALADSFADYRGKGAPMPAIVVIADGYAALAETYPDADERLTLLARDAFKYGIYFILTGVSPRDIRFKLSNYFKMAVAFELIDKSYGEVVGRTDGMEPESYRGRGLARLDRPLEFQAALPEYRDGVVITRTREIVEKAAVGATGIASADAISQTEAGATGQVSAGVICRAAPIPVMPDIIYCDELNNSRWPNDSRRLNDFKDDLLIGLYDNDLSPVSLRFADYTSFIITGGPGSGKSSIAVAWIKNLPNADIYALDSGGAGFISVFDKPKDFDSTYVFNNTNVTDLSAVDIDSFVKSMEDELDKRKNELAAARRRGEDPAAVMTLWRQIIIAFDKFSEASDHEDYINLMKLIVRIVKKEHGARIAVLALDTPDGFESDYSEAARVIKSAQTGLLLGSARDQSVFSINLPYGKPEKEFAFCDGYLIKKRQFSEIRAAI